MKQLDLTTTTNIAGGYTSSSTMNTRFNFTVTENGNITNKVFGTMNATASQAYADIIQEVIESSSYSYNKTSGSSKNSLGNAVFDITVVKGDNTTVVTGSVDMADFGNSTW